MLGLVFGLIYDCVRIIRKLIIGDFSPKFQEKMSNKVFPKITNPLKKQNKKGRISKQVITAIFDFLYCFIITLPLTIFIHVVNSGNVRWYILAGVFGGILIYLFTIGKLTLLINEYIIFYIKIILSYLKYYILKPIKALIKKIKDKSSKLISKHKNRAKKRKTKLKNEEKKNARKTLISSGKI